MLYRMNNQEYWKNTRAKIKHSIDTLEDKMKKFQKVEQKGRDGNEEN